MKRILLLFVCMICSAAPIRYNPIASEKEIRDEFEESPSSINQPDTDGFTALMLAAQRGDLEKVKLFLELGADPNVKTLIPDKDGYVETTALHLSVMGGNNINNDSMIPSDLPGQKPPTKGIIAWLVENKADVRARNKNIVKPDTAARLIKGGQEPIHQIMWIQSLEKRMRVLRYLLAHGADVNAQDASGNTLVHWAVGNNDIEFVTQLSAEFGSEVNFEMKNAFGLTPQQYAQDSGYGQMAETLKGLTLKTNAPVSARDELGRTGLMVALMQRDKKSVERQLELNASVSVLDFEGNAPLHYAVRSGAMAPEFVALLFTKPPIMAGPTNLKGLTPLHFVVELPDDIAVKVAQLLVEHGALILAPDGNGNTVLHYAIEKQMKSLVAYLKSVLDTMVKEQAVTDALERIRQSNLIVATMTKNIFNKIAT